MKHVKKILGITSVLAASCLPMSSFANCSAIEYGEHLAWATDPDREADGPDKLHACPLRLVDTFDIAIPFYDHDRNRWKKGGTSQAYPSDYTLTVKPGTSEHLDLEAHIETGYPVWGQRGQDSGVIYMGSRNNHRKISERCDGKYADFYMSVHERHVEVETLSQAAIGAGFRVLGAAAATGAVGVGEVSGGASTTTESSTTSAKSFNKTVQFPSLKQCAFAYNGDVDATWWNPLSWWRDMHLTLSKS